MSERDPASVLAAVHLGRFPHVSIAPSVDDDGRPVPGGGTRGALQRLFAELVAIDASAAGAAEALAAARWRIANTLPPEGEIRAAFAELRAPARRTGLEAWGDVMRLFRRGNPNDRNPQPGDLGGDALAWRCLDAIGWSLLCRSNESDMPTHRAHFVRAYDAAAQREHALGVTLSSAPARRYLEAKPAGELMSAALKALGGGQ